MKAKEYIKNVLISVDQLVNTLLCGRPDETLSSRLYRNSRKYWYARLGMKVVDFIARPCGKEHCYNAYLSEVERKHLWGNVNADKMTTG